MIAALKNSELTDSAKRDLRKSDSVKITELN